MVSSASTYSNETSKRKNQVADFNGNIYCKTMATADVQ